MGLTNTTLSAAVNASDVYLAITSTASGFPAVGVLGSKQLLRVDGEDMLIDVVPVAGRVKVLMRGYNGTVARSHDILAPVTTSSDPSDFGNIPSGAVNPRPPYVDDLLNIGEDLTFTAAGTARVDGTSLPLPIKNTTYMVNKASAAAITLISGVAAQAGVELTFISQTAQAHTVTYTPGFLGDTTSSDVATSSSKVGATFKIKCGMTGLWAPVNTGTGTGWTLG